MGHIFLSHPIPFDNSSCCPIPSHWIPIKMQFNKSLQMYEKLSIMCTKYCYSYKERCKRTRYTNFVNFKVQKSLLFIIILALYHSGTHIWSHCAHSAKFQFPAHQFLSHRSRGKCNACCPILSHGTFPMEIPFHGQA